MFFIDRSADPHSATRVVTVSGAFDAIERAKSLIDQLVNADPAARAAMYNPYTPRGDETSVVVYVPNDKAGLIIGRGGETIKYIQRTHRVRVEIEISKVPSSERPVRITG